MNDLTFHDKDLLLESVVVDASRSYLKEAIDCYDAGAYRACAVMLSCAVFEDIRLKAESFARYDTWCTEFKNHVNSKRDEQESYESNVIEKVHSSKIFDPEQRSALVRIWKARNHAAHPSGVPVTGPQVADLIRIGIKNFLAKTELLGDESVEALLQDLQTVDLFPESHSHRAHQVTRALLQAIQPKAYFRIANEIVAGIRAGRGARFDHNGRNFLISMASTRERMKVSALTVALFKESTPNPDETWVLDVVAAAPEILAGVTKVSRAGADASLAAMCAGIAEDSDRSIALASNFQAMLEEMDADLLASGFRNTVDAMLEHVWYRAVIVNCLRKSEQLNVLAMYALTQRLEQPHDAGQFVDMMRRFRSENALAEAISDKQALTIVNLICRAAYLGDAKSRETIASGFENFPLLREKARRLIGTDPMEAIATQESYNGYWELEDTADCLGREELTAA